MNNFDPIPLFFIFGLFVGVMRSELKLPKDIYEFATIVLLLSIGLKGGIELSKHSVLDLLPQIMVVSLIGVIIPLLAYPVLRVLGKFKRVDAASVAAHYGSVSVGTFAVALSFLNTREVFYEEYMVLFLVALEIPAILVGIVIARGIRQDTQWKKITHEVFMGKGVLLLIGGLAIGWLAGAESAKAIKPLFFDLFKGILALFLLEMGIITAKQMGSLKRHGLFLLLFSVLTPLVSAVIGFAFGKLLGFSFGGTVLIATLSASASYIAVPAAMRISLPEANPTLSLTASLGITFPFNIIVGIPLYYNTIKAVY